MEVSEEAALYSYAQWTPSASLAAFELIKQKRGDAPQELRLSARLKMINSRLE